MLKCIFLPTEHNTHFYEGTLPSHFESQPSRYCSSSVVNGNVLEDELLLLAKLLDLIAWEMELVQWWHEVAEHEPFSNISVFSSFWAVFILLPVHLHIDLINQLRTFSVFVCV